jgi:hypothetical protein
MRKPVPETPAYAVDKLPASVKIGHADYGIVIMGAAESTSRDRWGECSHVEGVIRVMRYFPNSRQAAETLLHEINHAIYAVWGVDDADREERVVEHMTAGLTCVLRDNPWLLAWLAECLGG